MLGELDGNAVTHGPTCDKLPATNNREGAVHTRVDEGAGSRHLSDVVGVPSTLATVDDSAVTLPDAHASLIGSQAVVPLQTLPVDDVELFSRGSGNGAAQSEMPPAAAWAAPRQSYIKVVSDRDQCARTHVHKRVAVSSAGLPLYQCRHCDYVSDSYVVPPADVKF